MSRLLGWLRAEPVAVLTGLVVAAYNALAVFGLHLTTAQTAALAALGSAVLVILGAGTRAQVTPLTATRVPLGRLHRGGYTITRRHIPEVVVEGKRLGRHVHHDSRSLNYLVEPISKRQVASASWDRLIPVLDQGDVGACTGNAATGALGTDPTYPTLTAKIAAHLLNLDETEALALYSAAETIDGDGPYPPNDNGSSGLSVAKAALNAGLISGYQHITSVAAAQAAILTGPFIVGSDWWTGMDNPNAAGLVTATGTVRGGHEYECVGYDAATDLWHLVNSWGTSYGVNGHFYFTSATFAKLLADQGDATVFTPLVAPSPTPVPTPTPTSVVEVTDPAMVAHLKQLAAKTGETAAEFLAAKLAKLYPSVH